MAGRARGGGDDGGDAGTVACSLPLRASFSARRAIGLLPRGVSHWHGEGGTLPQNTQRLSRSLATPVQSFAYREHAVELRFHLEATAAWIAGVAAVKAGALPQGLPYVAPPNAPAGTCQQCAVGHAYLYTVLDALILDLRGTEMVGDAFLLDTRTARGEEYIREEGRGWVRADCETPVSVAADGACAG